MSCCTDCQQGRNCNGLGEPWSEGNYVVAGSVIAWGGYVRDAVGGSRWDDIVEGKVKQSLWSSGGFSWVDAGQIAGFLNQYVSIKVTAKVDFAHLGDVLKLIEGAIYQSGFRPETQSFWVESIPQSASGRVGIATPGTGGTTNQNNTPAQTGSNFDFCKYLNVPYVCYSPSPGAPGQTSLLDDLAALFGVGPTEAALIGAGLAIGGILLVKRFL